jgi:hypothetical protein
MADHAVAANDRHDDDDAEQQNNHPAGLLLHGANRSTTDAQMYHYTGGRAPQHITHVRIHCPLLYEAFHNCRRLLSVDFSSGGGSSSNNNSNNSLIDNIPLRAFANCISLKRLKLSGIRTIGTAAFRNCSSLAEVEFDELLCSVGYQAFCRCVGLKKIVIVPPFQNKKLLSDENTDSSSSDSKGDDGSPSEHHIKIHTDAFDKCTSLTTIQFPQHVYNTISYLHLSTWKDHIYQKMDDINHTLQTSACGNNKTRTIADWINGVSSSSSSLSKLSVHGIIQHCVSEHEKMLMEIALLLELYLWKMNLVDDDAMGDNHDEDREEDVHHNTTSVGHVEKKIKTEYGNKRSRLERRITCGASVVIKNVMPYLRLPE